MSLPPFKDLQIYAASLGDLPQRFFMDPEFEMLADCSVAVAGKTLPVHSQMLASASKVFCGMFQDTKRPESPITLPGPGNTTMAEALALLRFIYDPTSITKENIQLLSIRNHLEGVLRLADSTNCYQLLEKCKVLASGLLLDWPPTKPGASSDENADLEFNHAKAVRGFATDTKDEKLLESCYTYVSKRCNAITANAAQAASVEDAVSLVRQLSDYPDLLRAGFFYALRRNPKYTGKTITRVVDYDLGHFLPFSKSFIFIYKFQVIRSTVGQKIKPMADPKHAEFNWNGHQFNFYIRRNAEGYHLSLKLDLGVHPPGPRVDVTFHFFYLNWADPSKSVTRMVHFNFVAEENKCYRWKFTTASHLDSLLDEDGVLRVIVTDWKVTRDPVNPPQNANNNN
jgi:hypothetical protein